MNYIFTFLFFSPIHFPSCSGRLNFEISYMVILMIIGSFMDSLTSRGFVYLINSLLCVTESDSSVWNIFENDVHFEY